jgi:hypothetical protein
VEHGSNQRTLLALNSQSGEGVGSRATKSRDNEDRLGITTQDPQNWIRKVVIQERQKIGHQRATTIRVIIRPKEEQ